MPKKPKGPNPNIVKAAAKNLPKKGVPAKIKTLEAEVMDYRKATIAKPKKKTK